MKIENLKVGMVLKNYRHLCEVLEEPINAGKSKQIQIKNMERYFEYHKDGNKFVIDNIFDIKKEKVDNRKIGNNKTKYINLIEILILDLLVNSNGEKVFLPKHSILRKLKMINQNYAFCKTRVNKLSKYSNISEENINEFYSSTDSTLIRNLEVSLNSLKDRMLIIWSKEITICEAIENYSKDIIEKVQYDSYDEPIYTYSERLQVNHREATDEEKQYIVYCEKEIAKEYGLEKKSEIIRNGLWDEFMYKMRERLMPKGIIYYYNSYKIIFNYQHIEEELKDTIDFILDDDKKEETERELNDSIRNKIQDNSLKRHDKAIEKLIELDNVLGLPKDDKEYGKFKRRKDTKYIHEGNRLLQLLINIDTCDIKNKIKRVKLSP